MTRRILTDAERIASIREAITAARGDWHELTALYSIQADIEWLLKRAELASSTTAEAGEGPEDGPTDEQMAQDSGYESGLRAAVRPVEREGLDVSEGLNITPSRPLRLYQCPGCWSWGMHKVPLSDSSLECDCGERMACIDLRGEHEDDRAVWNAVPHGSLTR